LNKNFLHIFYLKLIEIQQVNILFLVFSVFEEKIKRIEANCNEMYEFWNNYHNDMGGKYIIKLILMK